MSINGGERSVKTSTGDADLEREIAEAMGEQSMDELIQQAEAADEALSPRPDAGDSSEGAPGGAPPPAARGGRASDDETTLELVRGRIAGIRGEDVFVDIAGVGGKHQGVVPLGQFDRPPRPGSIMDFVVERLDEAEGIYMLSREGAVGRLTWEQLHKGASTECRVVGTNKGGLEVEIVGGINAFMPASQVDLGHIEDLSIFVGQKVPAIVVELDRRGKKVVLSRKRFMEKQREQLRVKLWESLEVGQVRDGKISSVAEYGAFVDLGGADGLIHISDLAYSHVDKAEDIVKVGDEVRVKVLKLDPEKGRIGLGLKQTMPNPWDSVEGRIVAGSQVTGKVTRVQPFGAFVEIEEGIEGLLPISEMSWKRIGRPEEVVQEGDTYHLQVLTIDPAKRKLSLSLKQAKGDPWDGAAGKYAPRSLVEGTVTSIRDFGAFIELETGIEGLVHISELSSGRVQSVGSVLKVGETKQFRVKDVDEEQRRISLSLRAVDEAEAVEAASPQHPAGSSPAPQPAKKKPRRDNLKGGMGKSGALGTGLGDLKL